MKFSRLFSIFAVAVVLLSSIHSVFALNDFRSLPTASFRSIDPYGSVAKQLEVGQKDVFLSRIYIESRNALVRLKFIKFENLGTAEAGDVNNIALYINGTRVSDPQTLSSNVVTYLKSPHSIQPDFPVTVELKGNIVGGEGKTIALDPVLADNIQLTDENNADNVRLYKSELSMDIVPDRIVGSGAEGADSSIGSESGAEGAEGIQSDEIDSATEDEFQEEVITKNPFPDTDLEKLEGKAAANLQKKGIITGYPDGEFKGSNKVNRVEALKILLEAKLGDVEPQTLHGNFSDIEEGAWYARYLAKALNLGVINGYPDGTFKPGNTVNTAEFLKMMNLTFGVEENLEYSYGDVEESDWFARFAGAAHKYNMFPDRPHFLVPASELTRNEMVVAIYQYLKNQE